MRLKDYGFIVTAPGYDPERHRAVLGSREFRTTVVGVEPVRVACETARDLASAGVQVIELCGAFDDDSAKAVADAVGPAVPVGFITFRPEHDGRLRELLDESESATRGVRRYCP